MSVSSSSGAAYNEFYDQASVSAGESIDSFVAGRPPGREKGPKGGRYKPKGPAKKNEGLLDTLLKPFGYCCSPFKRNSEPDRAAVIPIDATSGYLNDAALGGLVGGLIGQESSDEESQSRRKRGRRRSGGKSESSAGTFEDFPQNAAVQQLDGKPARRGPEAEYEKLALWKVVLPADEVVEDGCELSGRQLEFAVATWCTWIENSQQMTQRMLHQLARAANEQPDDVRVVEKIRSQEDEFSVLEIVRQLETRMCQEVLSDLYEGINQLEGASGALYLTLKQGDYAAGINVRSQGEALFLSVYDPNKALGRGPGFFGFQTAEDLGEFVIGVFDTLGSSERFQSALLKSKYTYLKPPEFERKDWEKSEVTKIREGPQKDDPRLEAKLVYGAMYKATKTPAENERIFSWAPQAGMHVQTPAEVARERGFRKKEN